MWGPAELKGRRVMLVRPPQEKKVAFASEEAAIQFEWSRIREKLRTGYERTPRGTKQTRTKGVCKP